MKCLSGSCANERRYWLTLSDASGSLRVTLGACEHHAAMARESGVTFFNGEHGRVIAASTIDQPSVS